MYLSVIECHKQNDSKLRCNDMSTKFWLTINHLQATASHKMRWGEKKVRIKKNSKHKIICGFNLFFCCCCCWDIVLCGALDQSLSTPCLRSLFFPFLWPCSSAMALHRLPIKALVMCICHSQTPWIYVQFDCIRFVGFSHTITYHRHRHHHHTIYHFISKRHNKWKRIINEMKHSTAIATHITVDDFI